MRQLIPFDQREVFGAVNVEGLVSLRTTSINSPAAKSDGTFPSIIETYLPMKGLVAGEKFVYDVPNFTKCKTNLVSAIAEDVSTQRRNFGFVEANAVLLSNLEDKGPDDRAPYRVFVYTMSFFKIGEETTA